MVPSLINILKEGGSCEKLEGALKCLNGLIGPMPSTLVVNMNTYLEQLSALGGSAFEKVRICVCQALNSL